MVKEKSNNIAIMQSERIYTKLLGRNKRKEKKNLPQNGKGQSRLGNGQSNSDYLAKARETISLSKRKKGKQK